jgi:hypothetical protein
MYQPGITPTKMYWLLGRKSKLSTSNKLLIYKTMLKTIWTNGIQLWGMASTSNIEILERFQSLALLMIVDAPWWRSLGRYSLLSDESHGIIIINVYILFQLIYITFLKIYHDFRVHCILKLTETVSFRVLCDLLLHYCHVFPHCIESICLQSWVCRSLCR